MSRPFDSLSELREFGLLFARMIAAMAMDPHGYFEKEYTARIENSDSDAEICGVIAHLVQWVVSPTISNEERASLDAQLQNQGLPSVEQLQIQFLP